MPYGHVRMTRLSPRRCEIFYMDLKNPATTKAFVDMTPLAETRLALAEDTRCATEEIVRRVQGEFLEMPGMRVTEAQARRLWGLDAATCSALLSALIDAKFLFRTRDGAFMRIEHARPVKANLASRTARVITAA